MTCAPVLGVTTPNLFVEPASMTGWMDINAMMLDTCWKWQSAAWQACQEMQADWIRQWLELARDWPATFVGWRGAEQLA